MKTNKAAITLTEYRMGGHGTPPSTRKVTVPISRIARVNGHPIAATVAAIVQADTFKQPYGGNVILRTPEDYLLTVESPEEIEAMMNS